MKIIGSVRRVTHPSTHWFIIIIMIESKCLPSMLNGIDAGRLNKVDINVMDFEVDRFLRCCPEVKM